MFWKKSADAVRIAELEAAVMDAKRERDEWQRGAEYWETRHKEAAHALEAERHLTETLDKGMEAYRRERDKALEQLAPFLARREKAKQNLRQYRKPASNGVAVQH